MSCPLRSAPGLKLGQSLGLWMILSLLSFAGVGGKFTRYVTTVMPAVFITAALGIQFAGRALGRWLATLLNNQSIKIYARIAVALIVILSGCWAAIHARPYYRLYYNPIGDGHMLFPQDDLYDAYMRDAMNEIAKRAAPDARVLSEIQNLASYYANRANRSDLRCLELSDPNDLKLIHPGDFVIDARGRTYYSNQAVLMRLRAASKPAFNISVGQMPAADVYILDPTSLAALLGTSHGDLTISD